MNAGVLILCVAVFWSAFPRLAGAHGVRVAVAIATATDSTPGNDISGLDGMQLGIDQSPDVGHTPGPDAGDHLGGVDVELVVSARTLQGDELVIDEAEVVVILDPSLVADVARQFADRSTLLVAVLAEDTAIPEIRPDRMVVLRSSPLNDSSTTASDFETAFAAAHQRPPSAGDALGYDVSQLLDAVLSETDGAVSGVSAASGFWSEAQTRLTSSRIEVAFAADGSAADRLTPTTTAADKTSRLFGPSTLLVLGVAGLAALALAALRWRHGSSERD